MFAGRDDRAVAAQVQKLRLLLVIVVPHRYWIQTTASAHVVISQTSRAEAAVTWFDSRSAETFAPADAGSRINVRIEHCGSYGQHLFFNRDIVEAMNVDHIRAPLAKRAER